MSGNMLGPISAFTVYADSELRTKDGALIAVIPNYKHDIAVRLAACWNACIGLTQNQLDESHTLDHANVRREVARIGVVNDLQAQRDELLGSLKRLSAQCARMRLPGAPLSDAEKEACVAIAKSTGDAE